MMPTSTDILAGLTAITNDWRGVAITWHVFLATALFGLLMGWRPSRHLVGVLLTAPLATVSTLAWTAGNPFNGAAALSLGLAALAARLPAGAIHIGPPMLVSRSPDCPSACCPWTCRHQRFPDLRFHPDGRGEGS